MTDSFTALVFAVGFGGWVYSKVMKNTNNQQSSVIAGVATGIGGFVVIFTMMKYVLHY